MGPPLPVPPGSPVPDRWTQVYQIAGRMVSPFHPVPGQTDDLHAPFLLQAGTPRGPFSYVWWEYDTYRWTLPWRRRGSGMDVREVDEQHRQASYDMGCQWVG